MRIIFFGSVKFSKACLEKLIEDKYNIVGICTLKESNFNSDFFDLSIIAKKEKISYIYYNNLDVNENIIWIENLKPDIIFCIGWSKILNELLLKIPKLGVVGYHPALLPANRGRHPIIWALNLGLEETGSTFFFMDRNADSGPIISQKKIIISQEDDAQSLYKKLVLTARSQISEFVPLLVSNKLFAFKQDHSKANYWRKRNFKDGIIDWRMSSVSIKNLIRSLTKPYDGAVFIYKEKIYRVWKSELIDNQKINFEPGKILNVQGENEYIVKCGIGSIKIYKIEPEIILVKGEYL